MSDHRSRRQVTGRSSVNCPCQMRGLHWEDCLDASKSRILMSLRRHERPLASLKRRSILIAATRVGGSFRGRGIGSFVHHSEPLNPSFGWGISPPKAPFGAA